MCGFSLLPPAYGGRDTEAAFLTWFYTTSDLEPEAMGQSGKPALKMGTQSFWAKRPEGWGLLIKRFWREFSPWMGFPRGGEESKKREARFEPSGSLGGLGKAPQRKCPSWVKLGQIVKVATFNFCFTDFQLSEYTASLDDHCFRHCFRQYSSPPSPWYSWHQGMNCRVQRVLIG